jgi:hypothetical protein
MSSPKKSGRPLLLEQSPEIQAKLVQAVAAGNYLETAASYAGISKDTLYRWLRRGAKERQGPYHAFAEAVQKALADAEVRDVARVAQAAEKNWQAAAWRLERKFPAKWGRRDTGGYSAEQFTAFVAQVAGFVRQHLAKDKRVLFNQALTTWLNEMEQKRVGSAT